ncbi:MAG: sensor histidine kinase [Deltaproteobacteria bacterium]|nr:MAG: sensor histidine kinase [Deltaproteobacteria bacterium]
MMETPDLMPRIGFGGSCLLPHGAEWRNSMSSPKTAFAPAERVDAETISRDHHLIMQSALLDHLARTIPCILMVLNQERQVVYYNRRLLALRDESGDEAILGRRPGEIFGCIHARAAAGGCGTTEYCKVCGATTTVLLSQVKEETVEDECTICTHHGAVYEFRVWASPYQCHDQSFTVVTFLDIRDEKRREALERTFFHDINDILNVLIGYTGLLEEIDLLEDLEDAEAFLEAIQTTAWRLHEEIEAQRRLLEAERGELVLRLSPIDPNTLLYEVKALFSQAAEFREREIVLDTHAEGGEIESDPVLLRRILANMVKNALEATSPEDQIEISCHGDRHSVRFQVHNPGYIPRSVQLQIFRRSFSTKGKGRGVGTYSMKLLGERYLKGKVWFTSTKGEGTTFYLSLPRQIPATGPSTGDAQKEE